MWMDVAQEVDPDPEPRSDDEDTVYDRNSEFRRNPFVEDPQRRMLEEGDTRCGLWNWRPQWLQQFVNPNTFIGTFVITGILSGVSWSYFTASISTMEKRLQISSETTGALFAGNELAHVMMSIIFSYFYIRRKRMKYITLGVALWAFSCYILASHQMFFGSGKYALSMTKFKDEVGNETEATEFATTLNVQFIAHRMQSTSQLCLREVEFLNKTGENCAIGDSGSALPVFFVLVAQLLSGAGTMLFMSSGGPYLEDVVMPDQLPILFGITLSLRLVGPFVGYIFGSGFLRVFISASNTPTIDEYDPRWMGAWWLGWLILGILMTMAAMVMSTFPAQMPKEVLKKRSVTTDTGPPLLCLNSATVSMNSAELKIANSLPISNNFMKTFMVFFNNDINVFITLSTIFHIFVGIGYWTFFPKYLETIFREPAAKASVLTGCITVTSSVVGLLCSGFFISKVLPNAERVSFWNVVITASQILIFIVVTQFGCDSGEMIASSTKLLSSTTNAPEMAMPMSSTTVSINESTVEMHASTMTTPRNRAGVHLFSNCSAGCDCKLGPMIPLCDEETGRVFYSPCHAGCESFNMGENGTTYFTNCSCASEGVALVEGFCRDQGCYAGLVTFTLLTATSQLLAGSGVIGKMLIFYKSMIPEGRGLVISIGILMVSVFAIIPSTILFGAIIDSACHIWEMTCSGTFGHCWHYSSKMLRYGFNLAAAGFLVCGGIFDILLFRKVKVKDVRLYDGDIDQIPKPLPIDQPFDDIPRN